MSRYLQATHDTPASPIVTTMPGDGEVMNVGLTEPRRGTAFVVKLRDRGTRIWGNEVEVLASSPLDAAELVAGERLRGGHGERANLRARVWTLPHGSVPEIQFFIDGAASAA